jgi:hypothetical protein
MVVLGLLDRRGGSPAPETLGLMRQYQVRMIVGLAMLEGAALFNTVAFLLEGHWWSLAVVGVLLAFMLAAGVAGGTCSAGEMRNDIDGRKSAAT